MINQAYVYCKSDKLFIYPMTFGEWLRTKLKQTDLSNAEVARRVGVSPTYIGNLVRDFSPNTKSGKVRPSEEVVAAIAKAVGASLNEARTAAGYASTDNRLPNFLYTIDFQIFDPEDLSEIENFIRFKMLQKHGNVVSYEDTEFADIPELTYEDLLREGGRTPEEARRRAEEIRREAEKNAA